AGRHIRPRPHFKLMIGRDQAENQFLSGFRKGRVVIQTVNLAGPLTLMEGDTSSPEDRLLACRIAARYSKGKDMDKVQLKVEHAGVSEIVEVSPLPAHELPDHWHV
ncbi:MAG TPA: tRNA (5-methylaminomethyl-2-thiouridylate)-methyltransferase, partial [Magnetococcales bacterium]|nr:tRNA (5-methylaminomethyl-2-thiouridylate)-methyltransferase [Magnetococcales bacterium]